VTWKQRWARFSVLRGEGLAGLSDHQGRPHEQNGLGTPSPQPSLVVRSPRSTPYQDRGHQMYPEPHVEPLMRMNKDQHQCPWKQSPQDSSPGLRDKEPPHVDPPNKQRKPGKKQAQNKEPDRDPVRQRPYWHWHVLAPRQSAPPPLYGGNLLNSTPIAYLPSQLQSVRSVALINEPREYSLSTRPFRPSACPLALKPKESRADEPSFLG
jgi:hypothetical protein